MCNCYQTAIVECVEHVRWTSIRYLEGKHSLEKMISDGETGTVSNMFGIEMLAYMQEEGWSVSPDVHRVIEIHHETDLHSYLKVHLLTFVSLSTPAECLYTVGPERVGESALSLFSKGAEITSIPSGDTAHSSFRASTSFGMRYRRLNCRVTNPEPSCSRVTC